MADIFIETRRYGAIIKVTAIDGTTGREVSFQAPASTPRTALQRLATAKLNYVMRKKPT